MNPNATLDALAEALEDGDLSEAGVCATDLIVGLRELGVRPEDFDLPRMVRMLEAIAALE